MLVKGVKYCGFINTLSGMGNACRNYIQALDTIGIPLTVEQAPNIISTINMGKAHETALKLEARDIPYNIKILHLTPDLAVRYLEPMKYHIFHVFWETDKLPEGHVWGLNLCDEVWTGSEWSKKAFRKSGVKKPIYVFPQAIQTKVKAESFTIENKPDYMFYSIFQWIERKNPKGLLTAYWKEFEGNDKVGLMIKTFIEQFTSEEKNTIIMQIKEWKKELGLSHYPKTYLFTETMTEQEVFRFHQTGDCFVSAHRGEGWGIPIAEAMSVGKPVISTNLGGIHEFVPEAFWYPVTYRMTNVENMDWIPFYKKDQKWANPDEGDLRTKMRSVYQNRGLAEGAALRAQRWVEDQFNYEKIGNILRIRLEEIEEKLKV